MWIWIWLGVIVVTALVEFMTMEMVSIWCSAGAIVALILAACKVEPELQIIVFFLISIILILCLRRVTLKYLNKNDNAKLTTAENTIGNTYKLVSAITDGDAGTIKINGVLWSVKSEDNMPIEAGETVTVVKLSGNKYIVKKVNGKIEEKEKK